MLYELKNIVGATSFYKSKNEAFCLIDYTLNSFGILTENTEDMNEISKNKEHDLISIKNHENFYYYGFTLYSEAINNLLSLDYKILKDYGNTIFMPPGFENQKSIAIKFKDGSILIYLERVNTVYQGMWFLDLKNFKYFYDNNYVD